MINNYSTIDPRALYSTIQDKKLEVLSQIKDKTGNFKKLLNKEVEKKKLKEVAQQLESIFVNMMFKSMRKNINKHRLIKENPAENIFNDMLYQEYSLKLAKTSKFGLAEQIYQQYSQYI